MIFYDCVFNLIVILRIFVNRVDYLILRKVKCKCKCNVYLYLIHASFGANNFNSFLVLLFFI